MVPAQPHHVTRPVEIAPEMPARHIHCFVARSEVHDPAFKAAQETFAELDGEAGVERPLGRGVGSVNLAKRAPPSLSALLDGGHGARCAFAPPYDRVDASRRSASNDRADPCRTSHTVAVLIVSSAGSILIPAGRSGHA
jgi:hypothetical protein